jgi:hypothetical protein
MEENERRIFERKGVRKREKEKIARKRKKKC